MASQTFKLMFHSHNAMEILDLAYARSGRQIKMPRIRQMDDRATLVYFTHQKGNQLVAKDLTFLYETLEGFTATAINALRDIQSDVHYMLTEDPLMSGVRNSAEGQQITFKVKTPLGGGMLRAVAIYDNIMRDLVALKKSGYFTQARRYRELIELSGKPIRTMLDNINITMIQAQRWLEAMDEPKQA